MREQTSSIAGLPADGSTMVSGLPTAPAEEKPPPDWPLSLVMTVVAVGLALLLISGDWGERAAGDARAGVPAGGAAVKGSYLEAENFREALAEIDRRTGGKARVQLMSVEPGFVWAVVDVGRRQRVIRVEPGGVSDENRGKASDGDTTPLSAVDREAPQRLVRGMRERFGIRPEQIHFVSMAGWTGTWGASLKATDRRKPGAYYIADEQGRNIKAPG